MLLLTLTLIGCREPPACNEGVADAPRGSSSGALEAGDVLIVEVCENALAARVHVKTNKSATAEVHFGPSGQDYQWKVSSGDGSAAATEHDLLVIGMRAETDYEFLVVLTADDETVALEPVTWTAGSPPDHVLPADVSAHDPARAWDGWTLMDLNHAGAPFTAVMFDMEGYPVWYHVMEGTKVVGGLDAQLTWRDTVLLGGSLSAGDRPVEVALDGSELWVGPEQLGEDDDEYMHHHFELLESGNYLTLEKVFVDGVRGDVIREMTPDLSSAWSWNTFDWLDPNWDTSDWTHSNWVQISDDGFVYLSVREESAIYKIDYDTGEILWRLGEGGDFQLEAGAWFQQQHAPSVLEGGNILVYDNLGDNRIARAVEYALDEQAMTAEQVWVYGGDSDEGWISEYWGDADRLPNGNTLITAGANKLNTIFEVTSGGDIVWQLEHRTVDGVTNTMYRAERVTPPLIEPL